jgi:hypothetical protein
MSGAERSGYDLAEELRRTQRKCFALRKELRILHAAFDESEIVAVRAEKDGYRKALANIAHRLEQGSEIEIKTLRSIVYGALDSRNLKPSRRRLVRRTKEATDA